MAIAGKQFREDLYYRLSMVEIKAPALEARKEDLPLLTRHFVNRFSREYGKEINGLTQRAQIVLARHNWPGNVRELENVLGHARMMALGLTIDIQDLPEYLRRPAKMPSEVIYLTLPERTTTLEDSEKRLIVDALARAAGNQSAAARDLRIGRDSLRYKMKKYGLVSDESDSTTSAAGA